MLLFICMFYCLYNFADTFDVFFPFFRSPLHPVLGLTFDRVTAFARGGIIVAYKTFLDPNAVLLPGCDK